ncbi:MAG: hypothetical protein Q9218_005203 [Villophora microphyllina]
MTFDDYFREGEQKSKEEDFSPSTKGTSPLPPPPKSATRPPQAKSPEPAADKQHEGHRLEFVAVRVLLEEGFVCEDYLTPRGPFLS